MTSSIRTSLAALLAVAATAAVVPAHAAADPQPVHPFVPGVGDDPDLDAAWQRWEAKDLHDYVLTVRTSCFCVPTAAVRTVVRGDRVVRVTRGDRRLAPARGWSMDEMFARIREAQASADAVRVDYTRRGVPTSVAVDPDERIADEETYYTVSLSRL